MNCFWRKQFITRKSYFYTATKHEELSKASIILSEMKNARLYVASNDALVQAPKPIFKPLLFIKKSLALSLEFKLKRKVI